MTVTTSYPGIYIQELPSLVHTIQPAPTSIAVFVGYTNPFFPKTNNLFGTPVLLLSFADYQANFGGFFFSPWQPDYVGQAVFQFFLNGGQTCYVVALQPKHYVDGSASPPSVEAATVTIGAGADTIVFTALQPVQASQPTSGPAASNPPASGPPASNQPAAGPPASNPPAPNPPASNPPAPNPPASNPPAPNPPASNPLAVTPGVALGIPMQIQLSNLQPPTSPVTADVVITYGTLVETYRKVSVANLQTTLQNSNLVTVTVNGQPSWPANQPTFSLAYPAASIPPTGSTVIDPAGFGPVFADNAPLDKVPIFNLLVTPGITNNAVVSEAIAYCERKRAFYIMDTPPPSNPLPPATTPSATPAPPMPNKPWDVDDLVQKPSQDPTFLSTHIPVSINAAVYYPWLVTSDPITGATSTAPPSGFVAGMYGQEDNTRGVWKSPAGIETTLRGTIGVDPNGVMTDLQQGVLNQNAINCLRQFPGIGTVIFGARTTAGADANSAQQQWRYVAVRRMALFIEQTLYANLTWAVFEGNSTPLWNALTQEVTAFMLSLFRLGAFAGDTPSKAFVVKCDSTTTTADDIANGIVNILVGFAPLVPAEFVVVKIAQLTGQAQS